jgi:TolB-like protein
MGFLEPAYGIRRKSMWHRRKKCQRGLFALGVVILGIIASSDPLWARTYDFDEGIEVLTKGLLSVKQQPLKGEKIAIFGIIESNSNKRWEVSNHIEDGIVDVLVNAGYTVIERRRINDIVKKELKKSADFWFDEAEVTQIGKLVGADVVVTGRYVRWGKTSLRISIRAIRVSDGKILAANKVKILTDRIADLLKPVPEPQHENEADMEPIQQETAETPRNQPRQQVQPQPQPRTSPTPNQPATPSTPPPATTQMGSYCCDQFGNRRCMLVQPFPLGSVCFCPGQGYGYTCP